MGKSDLPQTATQSSDVAAFLEQLAKVPAPVRTAGPGRLIFALDATMSRQPTWDAACEIQSEMFSAVADTGGLAVQLVSFRGTREFDVRPWTSSAGDLLKSMAGYACRGGLTQIDRVLRHGLSAVKAGPVHALVLIGDALEENPDRICDSAGRLGLAGVPVFIFQEGRDQRVQRVFQEVARLSKGAYARFDAASAKTLRELLRAVAVYAAGGTKALAHHARQTGGVALLIHRQLGGG